MEVPRQSYKISYIERIRKDEEKFEELKRDIIESKNKDRLTYERKQNRYD